MGLQFALLLVGLERGLVHFGTWRTYQRHVVSRLSTQGHSVKTVACMGATAIDHQYLRHVKPRLLNSTDPVIREIVAKLHIVAIVWDDIHVQFSRYASCFKEAIKVEAATGLAFDVYIAGRPDNVWFADLELPLTALHNVVHGRTRQLSCCPECKIDENYVGWHGCHGSDPRLANLARRMCRGGAFRGGLHRCAQPDDQLLIVPASLAEAVFIFDPYNTTLETYGNENYRIPTSNWTVETFGPDPIGNDYIGTCEKAQVLLLKGRESGMYNHMWQRRIPFCIHPLAFRLDTHFGHNRWPEPLQPQYSPKELIC